MFNTLFSALGNTRSSISKAFNKLKSGSMSQEEIENIEEKLLLADIGYDTVEIRNLQANLDLDYHLHPFTACMYIISGEVKIEDLNKKEYHLKEGDFIAVDSNDMHNEKTFAQGAKVIYGKKFDDMLGKQYENIFRECKNTKNINYVREK